MRAMTHNGAHWKAGVSRTVLLCSLVTSAVSGVILLTPAPPAAASVTVTGTGSSYAAVALDQWTSQIATIDGDDINYQTSSSVIGLNEFAQNQVDFGASEIGYSTGQSNYTPTENYEYMPDVAGATCLMYNLNSVTGQPVTNLKLDASTLMGIFTGTIPTWNSPQVAALNPGISLPDEPILKAFRTDASGDNFIFSDYFYTLYPTQWTQFTSTMGTPAGPQAIWPQPSDGTGGQHGPYNISGFEGQNGSDIASEYVAGTTNSITYVETAYAIEHKKPCAAILNPSGSFVTPSSLADATALQNDQLLPDLEQLLTNVFLSPQDGAYPISAYSYLIAADMPTPSSPAQPPAAIGQVLGQFVQFIACAGQQAAATLGYSPIPPVLVDDDFAAINRLNGAAKVPGDPTGAQCDNPYLTGQLQLVGQPTQVSGGGGSGGSVGTSGGGATVAIGNGTSSGGTSSSGTTVAGSTGSDGASSSGIATPNSASATAAASAAAAVEAKVAAASGAKAQKERGNTPGLALVSAIGQTSADPSTGTIFWLTLGFLALLIAVPLGSAGVRRFRRRRRSNDHPDLSGVEAT
jgi:phosphate transport system substrate-binding protein